jgi:hypothetical protein
MSVADLHSLKGAILTNGACFPKIFYTTKGTTLRGANASPALEVLLADMLILMRPEN